MTSPSRRNVEGSAAIGAAEQLSDVRVIFTSRMQLLQQRRIDCSERLAQLGQRAERCAQRREIARPRRAQRHARKNALDIANAAQLLAQPFEAAPIDQRDERRDSAPAAAL